jgi:uncharacterized membrane protein YoaK (UPF0700 family)
MTKNGGERPARDGPWHRDLRVVLLTVTSGAANAVSFLALGKVFTSVITGNLVLLGLVTATHSASEAIHAGTALGGYMVGVLAAAPLAAWRSRHAGTWPVAVTATLAAELCAMAAFCLGWELSGGRPRGGAQLTLLVLLSAALGMQSAAVRRLGQMSSTYLTSTLLGVLAGVVTGDRPDGLGRSLGALAALAVGALIGGLLATSAYAWLPALILVPLAVVIVGAVVVARRDRDRPVSIR